MGEARSRDTDVGRRSSRETGSGRGRLSAALAAESAKRWLLGVIKATVVKATVFGAAVLVATGLLAVVGSGTEASAAPNSVPDFLVAVSRSDATLIPLSPADGSQQGNPISVTNPNPPPAGFGPENVAITPDGRFAYVTDSNDFPNPGGAQAVTVIDLAAQKAGPVITVGNKPQGIAVTPDGKEVLVANGGTGEAGGLGGTVSVISTATNQVTATPTFPLDPGTPPASGTPPNLEGVAITPDGSTAWIDDYSGGMIYPLNLSDDSVGTPVHTGGSPFGITITPNGRTAYVSLSGDNQVVPVSLQGTPTPGLPIAVGETPQELAVSPDGSQVWVANLGLTSKTGSADVISTSDNVATPIAVPAGVQPVGIAMTPDAKTVWVSDQNTPGHVVPISTSTDTAGTPVQTGNEIFGLAVTPDQAPVAALHVTPAAAGSPSSLDATASTPVFGSITNYHWDFGDGSAPVDSGSGKMTHVYAGGTYTASVTVTDTAGTSTTQVFGGTQMIRDGGSSAEASQTFTVVTPNPYHPLTPYRIADTRPGSGQPYAGQTLGPNSTLNVQVSGVAGPQGQTVPTNATAVVLNVTAVAPSSGTYVTVWPSGQALPLASNLNVPVGGVVPNLVEVGLGAGGQVSTYNSLGNTNIVVDVEGYVGPSADTSGLFNPLTPARITDTRPGSGEPNAGHTLGPGGTLNMQVTGEGGVPAKGASAVVLNLTAVAPSSGTFLTAWPNGQSRPLASNLNPPAGHNVPNRVTVPVGAGGQVEIYNSLGSVDVVVDVGGWYTDANTSTGYKFSPAAAPMRIADTRSSSGEPYAGQTLGPNSTLGVQVASANGIPSSAAAVVANVTVVDTSAGSYLTAWPDLAPRPLASDLNWGPGEIVPNLVVTKLGSDGVLDLYNNLGSTDIIVDVGGWYS